MLLYLNVSYVTMLLIYPVTWSHFDEGEIVSVYLFMRMGVIVYLHFRREREVRNWKRINFVYTRINLSLLVVTTWPQSNVQTNNIKVTFCYNRILDVERTVACWMLWWYILYKYYIRFWLYKLGIAIIIYLCHNHKWWNFSVIKQFWNLIYFKNT